MSVLVGWRCSSGRRSEVPPSSRINQSAMPCPAFPHASAFAWQTGRCRVRTRSPRVRGFCLYRRRYGNSQHEPEPDRVPVRLFPATSLVRCLRGAAKCSSKQHCNQVNVSVRRLGSKWRTSATDEPRTRCESSYPDARRLSRFLPRLVHQRALEMICILNCNSNNRQQPSSVVPPSGGPSFFHNDTGGCSSVSSNR